MYDFCSYVFTIWLQRLEPKTVQPVVLAIPTALSRLNFDEIRSRYNSGGRGGAGGAAQWAHLRLPYTQKGLSTTTFSGSN